MSRPTDWPRLHRKERQGSRSKAGGRVVQRLLKRTAAGAATLFVVASGGSLFAQAQDFSGTWKLDKAASRFTLPAFSGGRGGTAVDWLFITHAANGTLVIGSETNGIKAWSYMPGHEGTIPVGRDSTMMVTSRWEGGRIIVEGNRSDLGMREVLSLSPDGQTLTIEVTTTMPDGERVNVLVYAKRHRVGPCETWATPCKEFPQ